MGKHTQKILTETETTGSIFPVPYTGNHGFLYEKRSSSGTLKLQFKSLNAENRWVDSGFKLTANCLKEALPLRGYFLQDARPYRSGRSL